ncbi:MAG: STAS domain-containing protein [Chloroflexia bacterium]|nr:STAS domain-containing protein [Chloroflexia bacterium]
MKQLRATCFPPLNAEERSRRLGLFRTLLVIQMGTTLGLVVSGVLDSLDNATNLIMVVILGLLVTVLSFGGYWLARRKSLRGGVGLLILGVLACLIYFTAFYGTRGSIPYFYIWPIMVSAILLEPALAFLTTGLVGLSYLGLSLSELLRLNLLAGRTVPMFLAERFAYWHQPHEPTVVFNFITMTVEVLIIYCAVTFLAWLASRSLRQAEYRSQSQARELSLYRNELEASLAELQQANAKLQASLAVIREVGTPVLPILEGVVLVPLVGAVDSERARQIMEQVLLEVEEERARAVIVDVTTVPMIDTMVAKVLVQTAQGARLLGAVPILVGIQPQAAETMVDLGVDLRGIVTRVSLRAGLVYALEKIVRNRQLAERISGEQSLNRSGGWHGLGSLDRAPRNR